MNDVSDGYAASIIDGVVALIIAGSGWVFTMHANRLNKIEEEQQSDHDDLLAYKLDSERRFAKEETLQSSLKRVHDCMEQYAEENRMANIEIRNDIKKLLAR